MSGEGRAPTLSVWPTTKMDRPLCCLRSLMISASVGADSGLIIAFPVSK